MRDYAESLIQKLPSDNECSLITTWYEEGDNRELYFSLCSTNEWKEDIYAPSASTRIVVETISTGELVECIPYKSSNGVASGEITSEFEGWEGHSFDFTSDVRMQLRSSQEMRKWGHKWPALCFEHWIKTENERDIDAEDERELLEALEREFDIDLREHSEYVGNIIIAIENRSCRVTFNESSEELSEAWFSGNDNLSDEQLLDLLDTWELVLGATTVSEIDLTLHREEYGTILYESEISLSESANISREEALELAKEQQQPSTVKVTAGDEVNRYHLPSIEAPGASDEILKASKNGCLIDKYSMPLMRIINLDIQVNSPTQSPSSGRVLPPTLHSDPSYSVGQYRWDKKITSSENDELETWVVDEQEDYDEIMNVIYDQMAGVVKISEPYLRPDLLNDLVQEGDSDLDLWIVVGHNSRYMNGMRADFHSCISDAANADKGLHILWLPGEESTPLHDRFILNDQTGLIIGTSFNSLDSNVTVVSDIGRDQSQELERNFDYWWNNQSFRRQHSVELIGST